MPLVYAWCLHLSTALGFEVYEGPRMCFVREWPCCPCDCVQLQVWFKFNISVNDFAQDVHQTVTVDSTLSEIALFGFLEGVITLLIVPQHSKIESRDTPVCVHLFPSDTVQEESRKLHKISVLLTNFFFLHLASRFAQAMVLSFIQSD